VELQAGSNEALYQIMLARYYSSSLDRFMSVDAHPGKLLIPQSWNRYTYALNNPLKYIDPDGLDVVVPTNARSAVAYAYRHSQTFRQEFNSAKNNHNINVTLNLVTRVSGARAKSDLNVTPANPVVDATGKLIGNSGGFKVEGTMNIPARGDKESGALTGHELDHVNLLSVEGAAKEGTPEYAEGELRADAAEAAIRADFADPSDDICRSGTDEGLRGTGPRGSSRKPSGFEELDQLSEQSHARKKELEAQGKW
jgi:RHS repeat-associated protein